MAEARGRHPASHLDDPIFDCHVAAMTDQKPAPDRQTESARMLAQWQRDYALLWYSPIRLRDFARRIALALDWTRR